MLSERASDRLVAVVANLAAIGVGFLTAWLLGFGWWVVLAAPVAGTVGWFCGWFAGTALAGWLRERGYAPAGRAVYRLRELPPGETTAGGKARALSRLLRAGRPVPDGLVLLPRGFAGDQLLPEAAAALAAALSRFPAGQRYAVRSSALSEDSAAASFAGAYETVLDVSADAVIAAVSRVRASGRTERVAAYADATGTRAGDLAVVVQAMVPAELAGVLFTVDPLTGDLSTMLGTVVAGLGESLVSGEQTGSSFTLARPSAGFAGPPQLQPYARQLHDLAHRAEGDFDGVPQDLEWAVAGGRVWLVQARPVTTLNPWQPASAERNDSLAGNCLWSATNLSEANPEAQTPLTVSLAAYQQAHGGPSMALRGREMVGYLGGRPYANLTVQVTARRGRKGTEDPRTTYQKMAGWWGDLPQDVPVPVLPLTAEDWKRAGIPLLGSLVRMGWHRWRLPGFLRTHRQRCARLRARVAAARTPEELHRLWYDELLRFGIGSFWAVIASGSEYPARLEAQLRRQLGEEDAAALMSNLSGLAGELESMGPAAGLAEVRAGRLGREEYLARYGHRGVNEVELAWPGPAEDPEWLDRLLAGAADGADLAALRRRNREHHDAAIARLRAHDPRRARQVARRVARAARHAALRERVRSEGVRTTGVFRAFALRSGDLLGIGEDVFLLTVDELLAALAGDRSPFRHFRLRRETLARYRSLPPLPALVFGRFDPFAWAADPGRRRDVYVAGAAPAPAPARAGEDVITGHAGAVGRVEGRVRRLDRLEDADQLLPGEVLVAPSTNIGWTPVFPRAAAIVTDLGAPLSHAAIVARELGVPAVVGCGDATARLGTGDRVEVDGAHGRVVVLERARVSSDAG